MDIGLFNGDPNNEVTTDEFYCPKCGNSGIIPGTNEMCDCQYATRELFKGVSNLDIPKQYLGINFNLRLVPKDCGDAYVSYLSNLHMSVTSMKMQNYTLLLCSPIAHSKTVMAYSAMEILFRNHIPTFPVLNVMEVRKVLHAIDTSTEESLESIKAPNNLTSAPYVFIKVPLMLSWEVYATMIDIKERRVRNGYTTIFLYDGYSEDLFRFDNRHLLESLKGNGYYGTIDIRTFYKLGDTTPEAKFNRLVRESQEIL